MSVLDHVVCVTAWVTWVGGFVGPWFAWAKLLRLFVSYVGKNIFAWKCSFFFFFACVGPKIFGKSFFR